MELYAVIKQSKYDYDFSVATTKHGIFVNKTEAINKAKAVFENLKEEDDYKLENLEYDIDEENGYFAMSFGFEEDYENHCVTVEKFELEPADVGTIYRKQKHDYFVEDVKAKAEEMEIELTNEEADEIADWAEDGLNNNDSYWEDYWMAIEYALEQK